MLLKDYVPAALCLQETHLKDTDNISIRNNTAFHTFSANNERAAGGVSIFINNNAPHSHIPLKTNLQAVAVSITLHRVITLCSIYVPPSSRLSAKDLDDLVPQLPSPFILLGDVNGHTILWGSKDINDKGRIIENFIDNHGLCLYNTNTPTYLHPATGTYTSLDLSICFPTLLLDYDWKVHDDLCGSDHFPVLLNNIGSDVDEPVSRWKLNKTKWAHDPIESFASILINIAEETVPKTETKSQKAKKPWFTEDCKTAIKQRKGALRQFNSRPTHDNLNNYRNFRAKARRTIKESKKKSWKQYVSKLNSRTSIKKVWDMVRKIKGNGKSSSLGHLNVNNKKVTSKKDISNTLADAFSKNSSSENYTQKFKNIKQQKEKRNLIFSSDNSETNNHPFSLTELKDALSKAHDSSPGPDDIRYQFLKHLSDTSLSVPLKTFNDIWETGNVPKSWKEATIIPIPKPGKDNTNPNNYRPIALTSCICKTLERMINERLVWYLEKNNLITKLQSGFRHQRSTNDHLVIRLETFIREAFIKKEHLVAVFFDLEKAYDTTWKYGILNYLRERGL